MNFLHLDEMTSPLSLLGNYFFNVPAGKKSSDNSITFLRKIQLPYDLFVP